MRFSMSWGSWCIWLKVIAPWKARFHVSLVGVYPSTFIPAEIAAITPGRASSTTIHFSGSEFMYLQAWRNKSGEGLPCLTSSALKMRLLNLSNKPVIPSVVFIFWCDRKQKWYESNLLNRKILEVCVSLYLIWRWASIGNLFHINRNQYNAC